MTHRHEGSTRSVCSVDDRSGTDPRARYEYRVWGRRADLQRHLSGLADSVHHDSIEDCYLLVADPACNAKIRGKRLKVKRLIDERFGFQRWSSTWHRLDRIPEPFGAMLAELTDQPHQWDDPQSLASAIGEVESLHSIRAVYVAKDRRRFRLGSIRAEAVELEIPGLGRPLTTVAFGGRDLGQLIQLRRTLGLDLAPNVAVHLAVDTDHPPSVGPLGPRRRWWHHRAAPG